MTVKTNYIYLQEVMDILGCGRTTVFKLLKEGRLPEGSKIGRCRRWRESDIRKVAEAMQPNDKTIKTILSTY